MTEPKWAIVTKVYEGPHVVAMKSSIPMPRAMADELICELRRKHEAYNGIAFELERVPSIEEQLEVIAQLDEERR